MAFRGATYRKLKNDRFQLQILRKGHYKARRETATEKTTRYFHEDG